MSVEAKLKEDVENLFYDYHKGNFDNVHPVALNNIINMLPGLSVIYKEESMRGIARAREEIQNSPNRKRSFNI